ncbi:hypothetical protein BGX29_011944, partial [Mortierella sp. GBA35]
MSHGDTSVDEPIPNGTKAASFAEAARKAKPPSPKTIKKCDPIFRMNTLPNGINLHVSSNSHDTLIFKIPNKTTKDIIVPLLLADAFDITACSEQAVKDAHYTHFEIRLQCIEDRPTVLETGLTIGDTVYKPFCPTSPGLRLE